MSWFWTAFWARLGWEAVPVVIVLGAFALFIGGLLLVATLSDLFAKLRRALKRS